MKKTNKPPTAKAIAKLAESGKNVSDLFTNKGTMMLPSKRINACPKSEELTR